MKNVSSMGNTIGFGKMYVLAEPAVLECSSGYTGEPVNGLGFGLGHRKGGHLFSSLESTRYRRHGTFSR